MCEKRLLQTDAIYQPYVYKWTNITNNKFYIGARWAKLSHPNDGYVCSSKLVKELIQKCPSHWRREILFIGVTAEEVVLWETQILTAFDAKHNPLMYNMNNGNGKFYFKAHTEAAKTKMRTTKRKTPSRKPMSQETKEKIRQKMLGREITWADKISKTLTGVKKK